MMSRGSMAAYSGGEGLQGGRPSYMGSGPSLSGRSSAMAPGAALRLLPISGVGILWRNSLDSHDPSYCCSAG